MVKIRRHMAPLTRTSGRGNKQKYITIHETANRGRGANANAHARLQAGTNSRQASWHYQVDSTEIVQSFDDNVRCWHAGAKANNESIAIEVCVNSDGNYDKALDNAAALVAHLRKKHNIPWNRVVSHKFWTGKNCPTIMLSRKGQWDKFIKATDPKGATKVSTSSGSSSSSSSSSSSKSISQMADEIIAGRHGSGHANRQRSLGVNNATYQKVRNEVNRRAGVNTSSSSSARPSKSISQMATEVINGRHGSGHTNRRRSLGVSQAVYNQVRAEVNRRASGGGSSSGGGGKSISQMATEVIQGKHGNGHANRQHSLGVNNATYAKVRAEVNRRS